MGPAKGYRDPAHQAKRWEAQADAWVCPNGCSHDVTSHMEHRPTWVRDEDGELVEVAHPRYRPGRFACQNDSCLCEFDMNGTSGAP